MHATVATILDRKGSEVTTLPTGATVADAAALLTQRTIGALVVSDDGTRVEGVVSERDIVRRIAEHGPDALAEPVHEVMTAEVVTCTRSDAIDELFSVVTERRIRHVPVVDEAGGLVGIVSIGDLVKWRMEELADESRQLRDYVSGSY